jgi:hypothetical protein
MREHEVNKLDSFVTGWYSDRLDIVNDILKYFHSNKHLQAPGVSGPEGIVQKGHKDSTDLILMDKYIANLYFEHIVTKCMELYLKKFPWCLDAVCGFRTMEDINIQHYAPGQGYPSWHTERATIILPNIARHMFFITYLNDVTDEGETEFFHQKIKIKPEKGLTIIAPADWTFTHRGIISPSQEKYIVTSWFHLYTEDPSQINIIKQSAIESLAAIQNETR